MDEPFAIYQSPYSWRYGSPKMREIWSELHKRVLWRRLWVALAEVQQQYGWVTPEQVDDLRVHQNDIDIPAALEIEKLIQHDLMAEVKVYASQCPMGGPIIHYGATSMDIKDNAEILQVKESLELVATGLREVLIHLAEVIEKTADLPCIAFTHLQPAEPTTYGYRFANHAQDLLDDYLQIKSFNMRGKGFKGAVGTAASYVEILGSVDAFEQFETRLAEKLGLAFYAVSTQTYSRKQDFQILAMLSSLAGSLNKLAFDFRLLHSQVIGEISEPFGENQVGSSAMPFKRNPINTEKIDSLARQISVLPLTAWNNFAHSLLERTLDDSANRRTILPEAFLGIDEILMTTQKVLSGMVFNQATIQRNLERFAPFAGTERLLMVLVKRGASRQEMHELLREASLTAWAEVESGKPNRLVELLSSEERIQQFLSPAEVQSFMSVDGYLGIAGSRSLQMVKEIRETINQ